MKKLAGSLLLSILLAALLPARPVHAKVLDLYGAVKAGAVGGKGFTDQQRADFYDIKAGSTLAFELGLELLFIDVSVVGLQFFDFGSKDPSSGNEGSLAGTMFQFLLGLDVDIPIDSQREPKLYLRLGANGGPAVGLPRRVNPPLDNGEVSDKGFVAHAIVALEYHINQVFYLGLEFQPGYHYFVPGGGAAVNDPSQGMQYMGFLTFQMHAEPTKWSKKK